MDTATDSPTLFDIDHVRPQTLLLNEDQIRAMNALTYFMKNTSQTSFLLLGAAGSGKTTVIVNALTNKYKVAFCAFTNKATQVLRSISNKFAVSFNADFQTIHKLLRLEPRTNDDNTSGLNLEFKFNIELIEYLTAYDVVIFDECSTISSDLYNYIMQTWMHLHFKGHDLKFIFLGDFWQLPPVNEPYGIVFKEAQEKKWPTSKLSQVMRSKTDQVTMLNTALLKWIDIFRKQKYDLIAAEYVADLPIHYPYNIFGSRYSYITNFDRFINAYIDKWQTQTDIVMLTYSKTSCDKMNFAVQTILNFNAERKEVLTNDKLVFYVGDRCCVDKPVTVYQIKHKSDHVQIDKAMDEILYNGEIFDVLLVENVKVKTQLNVAKYGIDEYFNAQKLTLRRIGEVDLYDVIHIPHEVVIAAKRKFRAACRMPPKVFQGIISDFNKAYPRLTYGYAMTIYKAQGSEWHTVLINLSSIYSSIFNTNNNKPITQDTHKQLFKATYTAVTRASNEAVLYHANY